MGGFIKDFRAELKSDIWMMPPLYHRVWQYLKYKVNHSPNKIPMEDGTFFDINPGQHLTSVRNIARGVGYYEGLQWKEPNPRTISKILEWLEKQLMITINRGRGNRQYTLITLSNWGLYQTNGEGGNSKTTAHTPPRTPDSKQPVHIKKNEEEGLKNEKKREVGKRVYDEESPSFILANFFYKEILKNDPKRRKPNLQTWSDDIRKILELDKRDKKEIGELIRWVQKDSFEQANVLSPKKLRERYTGLLLKMTNDKKGPVAVEPPVYERSKPNEKLDEQNTSTLGNVRLFK